MTNRHKITNLPKVPAKPLKGNIVIKRTVAKPTKEQLEEKQQKDEKGRLLPLGPIFIDSETIVYDIGDNNPEDLPFKVGDKINISTYGTEVITAEDEDETSETSYAIIGPGQVIGVYS